MRSPERLYEIDAYDPEDYRDLLLRVRADSARQAATAARECGFEVTRVTVAAYHRPTGDEVPWMTLFLTFGLVCTGLGVALL